MLNIPVPEVSSLVLALVMLGLGAAVGGSVRMLRRRRHPERPSRIGASASVLLGMLGSAVAFGVVGVIIPAQSFIESEVTAHPLAWVVPVLVALLAAGVVTWVAMDIAGRMVERRAHRPPAERLAAYRQAGEGPDVEFKSTARFNPATGTRDARLELVVAKTIAGFANATGGTLVIGVDDGAEIVGLAEDLALVKSPDVDRYELWLRDWVARSLGRTVSAAIRVEFARVDDQDVCLVTVPASGRPVFLTPGKDADPEFWVRTGNSTRRLTPPEMLEYVSGQRRFRRR